MHVRPGVGDTEGRHGYDFADAMGFHCGCGVGVGISHHARGRGVGGPWVIADADGVQGDDYGRGEVARARNDCFLDVLFLERGAFSGVSRRIDRVESGRELSLSLSVFFVFLTLDDG